MDLCIVKVLTITASKRQAADNGAFLFLPPNVTFKYIDAERQLTVEKPAILSMINSCRVLHEQLHFQNIEQTMYSSHQA